MSAPICDAHYDTRPALVENVSEWQTVQTCHRESIGQIWHGLSEPANVCHVHATGIAQLAAFHGHRERLNV